MQFSNMDKASCARREVEQRKRVYPRLIDTQRLSQREADRQIALMQEIAADYDRLAAGERLL